MIVSVCGISFLPSAKKRIFHTHTTATLPPRLSRASGPLSLHNTSPLFAPSPILLPYGPLITPPLLALLEYKYQHQSPLY